MIFNCKTSEAYHIKVLAELLTNTLKTGCFDVEDEGITLKMMDQSRDTLVDLNLLAENFQTYDFKSKEKICMGLNMNHFHKMLKSIKKKDSLQLVINEHKPTDLEITTIPKENNRVTTSAIKIQNIQNLDIDMPIGYGRPIIINSQEFSKMCKDLGSIGSVDIKIKATTSQIEFSCDADDILKRKVTFGEINNDNNEFLYNETFLTEHITRITKLAGLSNMIQIFPSPGLPLLFRTQVGNLGKISIYIKSKELIEKEESSDLSD